ncbi:hypothetical protein M8542_45560 [Amycolatopsis sp. OK19-0408]|uniref:Uncharacterized protein n=1 Tax=Amycolatopsis iheyensis TaxID=2945988 RepID=A0A9X2SQR9_9PSEU|nr:hypothetical protein [Amycolatopsis iheyensis]MCR6490103.1 hypothetical protein [Amycolatopsis iheyensis]
MTPQLTYDCRACGTTNRIPGHAGNRRVVCGKCRHSIPTPWIVKELLQVWNELDQLSRKLKPLDRPKNHREIARVLERQRITLVHIRDQPGYSTTSQTLLSLVVEIDVLVNDLERRLAGTTLKQAWRAVVEIRGVLKGLPQPERKSLPSGSPD